MFHCNRILHTKTVISETASVIVDLTLSNSFLCHFYQYLKYKTITQGRDSLLYLKCHFLKNFRIVSVLWSELNESMPYRVIVKGAFKLL